jgi:hypothetical protein
MEGLPRFVDDVTFESRQEPSEPAKELTEKEKEQWTKVSCARL